MSKTRWRGGQSDIHRRMMAGEAIPAWRPPARTAEEAVIAFAEQEGLLPRQRRAASPIERMVDAESEPTSEDRNAESDCPLCGMTVPHEFGKCERKDCPHITRAGWRPTCRRSRAKLVTSIDVGADVLMAAADAVLVWFETGGTDALADAARRLEAIGWSADGSTRNDMERAA